MAEINLVKFEGKALEKLIEVISSGIGTLYRPRAIRKEAESEAYKIEIIERAKSKALAEGKEIEIDTLDRIEERIINREIKKQRNIDQIAEFAAINLCNESEISDEVVNEDWATRFFNIAEDISDDEVQSIWAKILAGEIKKPHSYSLRTLEFLKNLSKDEAISFVKIARLTIKVKGKSYLFNPDNNSFLEANYGIELSDILKLKELGILNSESNLRITINKSAKNENIPIIYHNKAIILQRKMGATAQELPVLAFTSIASELSQLIEPTYEIIYLKRIKKHLANENVKVMFGDIINNENNEKIAINLKEIED